jgi:predicted nucleic acid-binding protein
VTPNVLTEASNLIAQIAGPARAEIRAALRAVIGLVEERHVPSGHAARREVFLALGLTDAALLTEAEASGARLQTADLDLYLAALRQGRTAENFRHRRAAEGESRPGR